MVRRLERASDTPRHPVSREGRHGPAFFLGPLGVPHMFCLFLILRLGQWLKDISRSTGWHLITSNCRGQRAGRLQSLLNPLPILIRCFPDAIFGHCHVTHRRSFFSLFTDPHSEVGTEFSLYPGCSALLYILTPPHGIRRFSQHSLPTLRVLLPSLPRQGYVTVVPRTTTYCPLQVFLLHHHPVIAKWAA